ncbi:hypothetical protein MTO96_001066 [Rhipicephalus appendiculatus]
MRGSRRAFLPSEWRSPFGAAARAQRVAVAASRRQVALGGHCRTERRASQIRTDGGMNMPRRRNAAQSKERQAAAPARPAEEGIALFVPSGHVREINANGRREKRTSSENECRGPST